MSAHDPHAMSSWPMKRYDFPMPIRYHLNAAKPPGLVICFHGYQDHALSMIRRLGWCDAELPFQLLAVNGPFPVPVWTGDGFKEAYSWYFRDTTRKLNFLPPEVTAEQLKKFLHDLKLEKVPKVLVGFSMGGFLGPYLAAVSENIRGIIGIGCGYNADAYARCQPLKVFAIHGEQDERISISNSQREYQDILRFGHTGNFHAIPGLGHRVEPSLDPLVRQLALECLSGAAAK